MTHRVDLIAAAERRVETVHARGQGQQRRAGGVQPGGVVVGWDELARRAGGERESVLQGRNRREVLGGIRVGEDPYRHQGVVGAAVVGPQFIGPGIVKDLFDVVVLADHHGRQVSVAVFGQRHGRARGEVDDGEAVEGVAVEADHGLTIDRGRFPIVQKGVDPAGVALQIGEHPIRLGPHEIVDIDMHRHRCTPHCCRQARYGPYCGPRGPFRAASRILTRVVSRNDGHRAGPVTALVIVLPTARTALRGPRRPTGRVGDAGVGVADVSVVPLRPRPIRRV